MRISDWSSDVCSSDLSGAAVNAGFIVSVLLHRLPGPRVSGAHPILPDNRNAASFFSSIYRPAKANSHGSYRQDCQMPVSHVAPGHCEVRQYAFEQVDKTYTAAGKPQTGQSNKPITK